MKNSIQLTVVLFAIVGLSTTAMAQSGSVKNHEGGSTRYASIAANSKVSSFGPRVAYAFTIK